MKKNKDRINELAHRVFDYLKAHNHVGKELGVTRLVLAQLLEISDRDLREAMREINLNPEFTQLVSTSHSVYICETTGEGIEASDATIKQAIALIKKWHAMIKKTQADGQVKIALDEDEYAEIVETFTRRGSK